MTQKQGYTYRYSDQVLADPHMENVAAKVLELAEREPSLVSEWLKGWARTFLIAKRCAYEEGRLPGMTPVIRRATFDADWRVIGDPKAPRAGADRKKAKRGGE